MSKYILHFPEEIKLLEDHNQWLDAVNLLYDQWKKKPTDEHNLVCVVMEAWYAMLELEYLETKGVPVIGYGTEELPAFYTRTSGFRVDYRMDTPEELAKAFKTQNDLGFPGGMLVTNPIPEEYAMPLETINVAIDQAIAECEAKGIHGKETTPFLLARVSELTGGNSLASNIRLVYNNAKVAAQTAVAYCNQK